MLYAIWQCILKQFPLFAPLAWYQELNSAKHIQESERNWDNYRGIIILNTYCKLYMSFIMNWLKIVIQSIVSEAQNGFCDGSACIDCKFSINQWNEKQKNRNKKRKLLPKKWRGLQMKSPKKNTCKLNIYVSTLTGQSEENNVCEYTVAPYLLCVRIHLFSSDWERPLQVLNHIC